MKVDDLKELTVKIEAKKAIIGKERDDLRELYQELEDLMFNLDDGMDHLNNAKESLDEAIEVLSEKM